MLTLVHSQLISFGRLLRRLLVFPPNIQDLDPVAPTRRMPSQHSRIDPSTTIIMNIIRELYDSLIVR